MSAVFFMTISRYDIDLGSGGRGEGSEGEPLGRGAGLARLEIGPRGPWILEFRNEQVAANEQGCG